MLQGTAELVGNITTTILRAQYLLNTDKVSFYDLDSSPPVSCLFDFLFPLTISLTDCLDGHPVWQEHDRPSTTRSNDTDGHARSCTSRGSYHGGPSRPPSSGSCRHISRRPVHGLHNRCPGPRQRAHRQDHLAGPPGERHPGLLPDGGAGPGEAPAPQHRPVLRERGGRGAPLPAAGVLRRPSLFDVLEGLPRRRLHVPDAIRATIAHGAQGWDLLVFPGDADDARVVLRM